MTYGVILTVACVLLALRYALISDASPASKCFIIGVAGGSFFIPWTVAVIVSRLVVSIYVILYLKAFPPGGTRIFWRG